MVSISLPHCFRPVADWPSFSLLSGTGKALWVRAPCLPQEQQPREEDGSGTAALHGVETSSRLRDCELTHRVSKSFWSTRVADICLEKDYAWDVAVRTKQLHSLNLPVRHV